MTEPIKPKPKTKLRKYGVYDKKSLTLAIKKNVEYIVLELSNGEEVEMRIQSPASHIRLNFKVPESVKVKRVGYSE